MERPQTSLDRLPSAAKRMTSKNTERPRTMQIVHRKEEALQLPAGVPDKFVRLRSSQSLRPRTTMSNVSRLGKSQSIESSFSQELKRAQTSQGARGKEEQTLWPFSTKSAKGYKLDLDKEDPLKYTENEMDYKPYFDPLNGSKIRWSKLIEDFTSFTAVDLQIQALKGLASAAFFKPSTLPSWLGPKLLPAIIKCMSTSSSPFVVLLGLRSLIKLAEIGEPWLREVLDNDSCSWMTKCFFHPEIALVAKFPRENFTLVQWDTRNSESEIASRRKDRERGLGQVSEEALKRQILITTCTLGHWSNEYSSVSTVDPNPRTCFVRVGGLIGLIHFLLERKSYLDVEPNSTVWAEFVYEHLRFCGFPLDVFKELRISAEKSFVVSKAEQADVKVMSMFNLSSQSGSSLKSAGKIVLLNTGCEKLGAVLDECGVERISQVDEIVDLIFAAVDKVAAKEEFCRKCAEDERRYRAIKNQAQKCVKQKAKPHRRKPTSSVQHVQRKSRVSSV